MTNNEMNAPTENPNTSILHNLEFIESLILFADADFELSQLEPSSPYYLKSEDERDSRIKAVADCVDAYCERRVTRSLAQAGLPGFEETAK